MSHPLKLTGYDVSMTSPPIANQAQTFAVHNPQKVQITLHGENFITRAMMLIIKIGDEEVREFEITPDQRALICYLDQLPEEGAIISVGYGGETRVELPERFSRSKLSGDIATLDV